MECGLHRHIREHRAPAQRVKLEQNGHGLDGRTALTQQPHRGIRGATGGEHVVNDEDTLPFMNGLGMHLHASRAVLELIIDADHVAGQLAGLTDREHAEPEFGGHGGTEDETARLEASDGVDAARVARTDQLDQFFERRAVGEQLGDITEQDAGLREIRNLQKVMLHQGGDR